MAATIEDVWPRIQRHAGGDFKAATGLRFAYRAPGQFIRVSREGREINRVLCRTHFAKALPGMPASNPSQLKDRQGSDYVRAILMGWFSFGQEFF